MWQRQKDELRVGGQRGGVQRTAGKVHESFEVREDLADGLPGMRLCCQRHQSHGRVLDQEAVQFRTPVYPLAPAMQARRRRALPCIVMA